MEINSTDPNLAPEESNAKLIFLLCLFPPVAIYKMWKNNRLHMWFPNLMIISALLNIPSLLTINIPMPDLGFTYTPIDTTPYFIAIIIISIIEIILGFYLRNKAQTEGSLTATHILISLFLMTIQYIPFMIMTTNTFSNIFSSIPTTNLDQLEF